MNRDEVEHGLTQLGFEVQRIHELDVLVPVWLNGEIIGVMSPEYLQLAEYIPSVVGKDWQSIKRRTFMYDKMKNLDGVKKALEELKDSAARYERYQREIRIRNVKLYFNYRKTQL